MENNHPQYQLLARIYDHLMSTINYENWGDYIWRIIRENGIDCSSALELGAGTGALSKFLFTRFKNYTLLDLSRHMLMHSPPDLTSKICGDILHLPIKGRFDVILSSFDTMNYILTKDQLFSVFSDIKNLLAPGGIFLFDASLENNSLSHEKDLNRKGEYDGIEYRQISKFNRKKKIHSNKFLLVDRQGNKYSEEHVQKIYEFYDYFYIIDSAGMWVKDCFDAFSFEDATEQSERAQFVIKRMK